MYDVNAHITGMVTAGGVRYDFGECHELLGRRMRDVELGCGRLYSLLHEGRGLLLDRTGALSAAGWADRVGHVVDAGGEVDVPRCCCCGGRTAMWRGPARTSGSCSACCPGGSALRPASS